MYDRICFPTDGSEGSMIALEHALDIADQYGADVHALYVVNSSYTEASPSHAAVLDDLEDRGEAVLGEVTARGEREGVTVVTELRHGEPHLAIREYAEEADADLVVMGTHGRTGLQRYLLGSVTEKVVRTADVPVLTVGLSQDAEAE